MDWFARLKLLVPDNEQRGRVTSKLALMHENARALIFRDDENDAVRASLLSLIEPAGAGMISFLKN